MAAGVIMACQTESRSGVEETITAKRGTKRAPEPENIPAPMPQWLVNKLIAYGITVAVGLVAYFVIQRTRMDPKKRATVGGVKRQAVGTGGVMIGIFGLTGVLLVALALLVGLPWWTLAFLAPIAIWAAWWLPASHRLIKSEASIVVQGLPVRVSAFVADVPGQVKWSPGAVSCTPQLQGPRGPRYLFVERGPDGKEFEGVVTLARDEPGVEVDLLLDGAGASGTYYSFAASDGGTMVTDRTVVELPYVLALIGGMFIVKGEAPAARQRRINEVQALKTAFESTGF